MLSAWQRWEDQSNIVWWGPVGWTVGPQVKASADDGNASAASTQKSAIGATDVRE